MEKMSDFPSDILWLLSLNSVIQGGDAGPDHHLVTARTQEKLKRMRSREAGDQLQQFQDVGTLEL